MKLAQFRLIRSIRSVSLSLAALMLAAAPAFAAEPAAPPQQPTAKDVIQKYVDATGGKAALEKIKSLEVHGKMEIANAGITLDLQMFQTKDGYFMTVAVPGVGEVSRGCKGDLAWSVDNGEARKLEGPEKAQLLENARMHEQLSWLNYDGKVEVAGEENVAGKPAWHLTFTPKSGNPIERYFAKDSGLLVKMSTKMVLPAGSLTTTSTYENYKDVDGIKMPEKHVQTVEGQGEFIITYTEIKTNVDIPASKFEPPAGIQ